MLLLVMFSAQMMTTPTGIASAAQQLILTRNSVNSLSLCRGEYMPFNRPILPSNAARVVGIVGAPSIVP